MPLRDMTTKHVADGRYQTLLKVPGAITAQPNLETALRNLRQLLSAVVSFESISLLLLNPEGNSIRLVAFDQSPESPEVAVGTQVVHAGTAVGEAIEVQEHVYVPDVSAELLRLAA